MARHAITGDLAVPISELVGRRREIEDLAGLVERERLVTVVGAGGSGKTRLAAAAAARLADSDRFELVCAVGLAPLSDPSFIAAKAVAALDATSDPARNSEANLVHHLADRRALLLLDNFEHLIASAPLVARLLARLPELHVLVTSRQVLRLSGEHVFDLAGLPLPGAPVPGARPERTDAVQLFERRAAASCPGFLVDDDTLAPVAAICRRLDGLPLAIELAAARCRLFDPATLEARLRDPMTLLTTGNVDAPDRHRSLEAAIGWSDGLLSPADRRVFHRLSVFAASWTIDLAEAVVGEPPDVGDAEPADAALTETIDAVAMLVDSSLVVPIHARGAARFAMLDTVREFARRELRRERELETTERRLAEAILALVESLEPQLLGRERRRALDRMAAEHDTIRAVLGWAVEHDTALGLRVATACWRFWQLRGRIVEGREWFRRLDLDHATGDPAIVAAAQTAAAGLAYWAGKFDKAVEGYERALAIREALPDRAAVWSAQFDLGTTLISLQMNAGASTDEVAEALERTASDASRGGEMLIAARARWALGFRGLFLGETAAAQSTFEATTEVFRANDDPFMLLWSLDGLAMAALAEHDYERARSAFLEVLELAEDGADVSALIKIAEDTARYAVAIGRPTDAVRLHAAAVALGGGVGQDFVRSTRELLDQGLPATATPTDIALEAASREGAALSLESALLLVRRVLSAGDDRPATRGGCTIHAFGRFELSIDGQPVDHWGAGKAGANQVQALVAFLFDRGDRGALKDEVLDVIWPDIEVALADTAFHRTVTAARQVLTTGPGGGPAAVEFSGGRYRLRPGLIAWSDVDAFEDAIGRGMRLAPSVNAIAALEGARLLYRADYMDDVPFFGPSEYAEGRRSALRQRLADALAALADSYETAGDRHTADDRRREAESLERLIA